MQKTLTYRHLTVAYEDVGHGHPVVLLHGFAEDGTLWKHQVLRFQDRYRFIVPDFPGSGLSPLPERGPAASETISMEVFADLVRAILDHEKIDRCCMIGHSMGGYVTLAFADVYPRYLCGFGLFHSTAYPDSAEKQQARLRGIAFIRENGAALFVRQSIPNLFGEGFKRDHPEEVNGLIQRGEHFKAEALMQYYEAMLKRPDRREVLSSCAVPVLLIAGVLDNAVPLKESLSQAALANSTHFFTLEGAAHMGMWETEETSGQILSDYFSYVFRNTNDIKEST